MAYSLSIITGFDASNEEMFTKYTLQDWRKNKLVDNEAVRIYFKNFKILANRLLDNKNNRDIMIKQNGATYYWLNEYYTPALTLSENK